jgi:hypothetical protein
MNQNELIERITKEVVARLQAIQPGPAGNATPFGEAISASDLARYIDHTLLKRPPKSRSGGSARRRRSTIFIRCA